MKAIIYFLTLFVTFHSHAALVEHVETAYFTDIEKKIIEVVEANPSWKKEDVLLVFDIDNTLLTQNQDLGGDAWFTWQESLLSDEDSDDFYKVAKDFPGLLKVQGILHTLSNMRTPEQKLAERVTRLQTLGDSLLLTSRGPDYRNATEAQLKRNSYSFSDPENCIADSKGVAGIYLPYDIENPEESGLSDEDAILIDGRKARPVTYMDGLYMTAGQHKGVMLKLLLKKMKAPQYQAIFFIDDHKKHSERMAAAYSHQPEALYIFHYTVMAPQVKKFHDSDKMEVTNQWKKLKSTMQAIFL